MDTAGTHTCAGITDARRRDKTDAESSATGEATTVDLRKGTITRTAPDRFRGSQVSEARAGAPWRFPDIWVREEGFCRGFHPCLLKDECLVVSQVEMNRVRGCWCSPAMGRDIEKAGVDEPPETKEGLRPSFSTHVVPRLRRCKHGAPVQEGACGGNCKFPARPTDSSRFIHLQVGNPAGQPSANRGVRWFRYRTCETALPFVCAMLDRICTCTRRFCARPAAVLLVATSTSLPMPIR